MNELEQLEVQIKFLEKQRRILEILNILDPEPVLNSLDLTPLRLVTWYSLRTEIAGPHYHRNNHPYSLHLIDFLKHFPEIINPEKPYSAYYVSKVRWSSKVRAFRNSFAPPYAPKNLESCICLELTEEGFTSFFENVDETNWIKYQENPTKVVPLTQENLVEVLRFTMTQSLK